MAVYKPTIPVREGHVLTVDGEQYHLLRRVDGPDHGDTFVVEHEGETTERHIDWFRDLTADAHRITIELEGVADDADMRFSAQEFGALLRWLMVSDPWPIEDVEEDRMKDMLNEEARARGYDGWIEAYHDFHGKEVDDGE